MKADRQVARQTSRKTEGGKRLGRKTTGRQTSIAFTICKERYRSDLWEINYNGTTE